MNTNLDNRELHEVSRAVNTIRGHFREKEQFCLLQMELQNLCPEPISRIPKSGFKRRLKALQGFSEWAHIRYKDSRIKGVVKGVISKAIDEEQALFARYEEKFSEYIKERQKPAAVVESDGDTDSEDLET
eukprot:Nk52_evm1s1683 gene=Nk52_evmTU1s1683